MTNYIKTGKGKAVVLLHGFLESCQIWLPIMEKLKDTCCLIAPDLLGHGKAGVISDVHSMEMMADDVLSILENEKISECLLVGHSMGGYVSLAFAEKYPNMVKGIVLMNSTPLPDSDEKKANREKVVKVIDNEKVFFIRNAITNLFSSENQILMKDTIEHFIDIALKTPKQGIKAASLGMKDRPNRVSVLNSLSGIKHFIIGKNDALIPSDDLIELAQNIKASYSVLNGGHMSYVENEAETIEILKKIINEV